MEKNGTCPKTADIGGFRFLEERNVPPTIKRGAAGPPRGTKILIRGSKPVRVLRNGTEALETKMVGATQKRIELGLRILPFYVGTEIWKPLANKIRNASRQILFIGGDLARKGA